MMVEQQANSIRPTPKKSPFQLLQQPLENISLKNSKCSLLLSKSQPSNLTLCKSNLNNYFFPITKTTQKLKTNKPSIRAKQFQNLKTTKFLAIDNINQNKFKKNFQNFDQEYYNLQNTAHILKKKYQKGNKLINCSDSQKRKKLCKHRIHTQFEDFILLQNLSKRMKVYQSQLRLNQRKTEFLCRQLDYLLSKEYERNERKMRKIKSSHIQHQFRSQSNRVTSSCPNSKNLRRCQKRVFQTQENCRKSKQFKQQTESCNKFHYRSQKKELSKMRQLIIFNQKQKKDKNHKHCLQKEKKNRQKNSFQNEIYKNYSLAKESPSIYDYLIDSQSPQFQVKYQGMTEKQ